MIEDIKTLLWLIIRPNYYSVIFDLIINKFRKNYDSKFFKKKSLEICLKKSLNIFDLYSKLEIDKSKYEKLSLFDINELNRINSLINSSNTNFGGEGFIDLLFLLCEKVQGRKVLETGVAYGWSSASILKSLINRNGKLISVDMAMVKQSNYELIGIAVSNFYKKNWQIINKPDKFGLIQAIKKLNYEYELAHYDSDKSYYGRMWAYPKIYKNLKKNGFFVIDDIEDNMSFHNFVDQNNLTYYITQYQNKFIGIIRK